MRLHKWSGPGFRVTAAEDRFFTQPLETTTAFRFSTDYFEVDPHAGATSIKLVLAGSETYYFHRRRVLLSPGADPAGQ